MSSIAGSLGFGSNDSKAGGFNAVGTQIDKPISTTDAQANLAQQNAFIQALQAQNGVGNQSAIFNQLGQVAQGQGPNPAQAQLANATGANTANQAALMAGQRGAGQNVGLLARQAAMQGAANQQNAAGQSAQIQANQSLNALNAQSGIAGQQVGNLGNAISTQQGNELGAIGNANSANVGMQSNINSNDAAIAGINTQNQAKTGQGVMSSIGQAIPIVGSLLSHGGYVGKGPKSILGRHLSKMADGGGVSAVAAPSVSAPVVAGPANPAAPAPVDKDSGGGKGGGGGDSGGGGMGSILSLAALLSSGGPVDSKKVDVVLSPGEGYLPPREAKEVVQRKENPMDKASVVPGKAKVKGDSLKNDTVPAQLEEGGIVIPRSIMEGKNAAAEAGKFIAKHLAKGKKS